MSIADSICYLHLNIKFTLQDSEVMDLACVSANCDSYSEMLPHMLGLARLALVSRDQGRRIVMVKGDQFKTLTLDMDWIHSCILAAHFPSTVHLNVRDYAVLVEIKQLLGSTISGIEKSDDVLISAIFGLYASAIRDYCSGEWKPMIETEGELKPVQVFRAAC